MLLLGSRRRAGTLVDVGDDLPYLIVRQEILPDWHRGVPRCGPRRQAGPSGGDAPEDVGFLQLANRAIVAKVGWNGVKGAGEVAIAIEIDPSAPCGSRRRVLDCELRV